MTRAASTSPAADALARYYDLDLADDPGDIDMYLALAASRDGPVLELMCGAGRVAVPLATHGHRVVAVDRDRAMLARAATYWQRVKRRAAKGGAIDFVEQDVTALKLKERFALVIVALNSLLLLDGRAAIQSAFKTVARHLAPNGRAVIDVWLPTPEDLVLYDGRLVLDWIKEDDEAQRTVSKTTSARYESAARTAHVTSFFDAWQDGQPVARTTREDTITFVSSDELERYARDAGLILDIIGGDYEMGQFGAHSERVVMVFRRLRR